MAQDPGCCGTGEVLNPDSDWVIVNTYFVRDMDGTEYGPFDNEDLAIWKQDELASEDIGANIYSTFEYFPKDEYAPKKTKTLKEEDTITGVQPDVPKAPKPKGRPKKSK